MRKLAWLTLGFGIADVLCAYFLPSWMAAASVILLAVGLLLLLGQKYFRFLRVITVATIGFALGTAWFFAYDAVYLNTVRNLDGQILEGALEVKDYPNQVNYGYSVEVLYRDSSKTYHAIAYLRDAPDVRPGDTLSGPFLCRFSARDEEGSARYKTGSGIYLSFRQTGDLSVSRIAKIPLKYIPLEINRQVAEKIDSLFSTDTAPFAKGLLLGDKTSLSYEDSNAFRISGISHIIAVSGLHVGILIALLYFLTGRRRFLSCILGLPMLLLFAAIVGFRPSVNRACLMQGLLLLSVALDREYDGVTALSFSGLVMMLLNPMVVIDIGFQLSYGSVLGIFLFYPKLHGWLAECKWVGSLKGKDLKFRIKRWIVGCFSVSLSASAFTTPLVAYYFGAVGLLNVVTNLLVLWSIPAIFYGAASAVALGFLLPRLVFIVSAAVSVLIRYVLAVARLIARIPFAALYTASIYSVLWLIFAYILVAAFLCMRKKPVKALLGCLSVSMLLCFACSWTEPRLDKCRMTVLDVGQGQSVLLSFDGKHYLVDCGGSYDSNASNAAADTLLSQGIFRVDGIILTHFDRDHWGGIAGFVHRIPTDALFVPEDPNSSEVQAQLEAEVGLAAQVVTDVIALQTGESSLRLLPSHIQKTSNETSLTVLFEQEKCDILIVGDQDSLGELAICREYDLPDVDVLVAGHHGSKTSTGDQLLNAVRPEIVVISVGRNNSYNLPSEELLQRLLAFGCSVYRTDECGTIIFRS